MIEANGRRVADEVKNRQTLRAIMDYQLAVLIAMGVNNPKGFPGSIEAAYPSFFDKKRQPIEEDWHMLKARVAAHGAAYAIRNRRGESS